MTNKEAKNILFDMLGDKIIVEPTKQNQAILTAIKALQQPRWIPCTERLPKPNRLVLCYITTGASATYFLAFWNDTQNDWEEGIGGCRLLENDLGYEVIAWMPLPQPYKINSKMGKVCR